MRLNGAAINASRLNAAGALLPKTFSGDSVGVVASELDAVRYALSGGSAVSLASAQLSASAKRFFGGDFLNVVATSIAANAVRSGAGVGAIVCDGGLYYTRLILGYGGAEIQIIAVSDVGVVYGDGEGVAIPTASMSGVRVRPGSGDAVATTDGALSPSAIRVPGTGDGVPLIPWIGALDTATITAGGIRRIDGTGAAIAYLTLDDNGFKRQVFIGSLDLEPIASGFATAVRHGTGATVITTDLSASFGTKRIAHGSATITTQAGGSGEVFVRGDGVAVVSLIASLTGYVYRRGSVLEALSTIVAELDGKRRRMGAGDATLVAFMVPTGTRTVVGSFQPLDTLLYGESFASDYNVTDMDDDAEVFYRASHARELARQSNTRELRRQ